MDALDIDDNNDNLYTVIMDEDEFDSFDIDNL